MSRNGITVESPSSTLFDLLDGCVEEAADRLFLDDGRRQVTFREFAERVERAAAGLADLGLGRGDSVLLQLPNLVEFAEAHVAAARLGAISVPLLPIYREAELRHFLGLFTPALVVTVPTVGDYDLDSCYRRLGKELGWDGTLIDVGPGSGDHNWADITGEGEVPPRPAADDLFVAFVTSGITGTPKGALRTHGQLALMGTALTKALESAGGVSLSYFPVSHLGGVGNTIYRSIAGRCTTLLRSAFDPADCLALIQDRKVTNLFLPVPHIVTLLDEPSLIGAHDISSLRQVETGGAAPPPAVVKGVQQLLGSAVINQYGMSEGLTCVTRPSDPPEYASSSCGRPLECEIRIFDTEAGAEAPDGEIGAIQVRGPMIFVGYHAEPERTAEAFTNDGWLQTGDLGYINGDGNVVVTGRAKDVINRGGEKISALDVENELMAHPAIAACAVVPIRDRRLGERACAFVVLRAGSELDLPALQGFFEGRGIAKVKWPERLETVASLPTTPTGKVQKFLLVEKLAPA